MRNAIVRYAVKAAALLAVLACAGQLMPAHAQGTHHVTVSYTRSVDDTQAAGQGYTLYRAPTCSSPFVQVNATLATTASITNGGLAPGAYCFNVTFSSGGVESAHSLTATAVILPAAPTGTTAAVDN